MGNYADPNVEDRTVLVAFGYASDDAHDPAARGEIVEAAVALGETVGADAEILTEESLAEKVRWALRGLRAGTYGRQGTAFDLSQDDERIVQAVVGRLL